MILVMLAVAEVCVLVDVEMLLMANHVFCDMPWYYPLCGISIGIEKLQKRKIGMSTPLSDFEEMILHDATKG